MNQKTITEMICILDKSGSMYGKEADTIGSYNQMLNQQKELPGEAYITTALFSDDCHILYCHTPVRQAEELTEKEYYVRGNTALLDALGKVITQSEQTISVHRQKCHAKVLVFIITDGMENASKYYSIRDIQKLVQEKQDDGWEFLFFGTDMEILGFAQQTGIKRENTLHYSRDADGIRSGYMTAGQRFSEIRKQTK